MVGFKRLNEFKEEASTLLTIRSTEAYLEKKMNEGKEIMTFYVKIEENPEIMTNKKERKNHFKTMEKKKKWFEKQLEKFKNSKNTKIDIADSKHPLEIVTGNISVILKIEDKEYYLLFCRDIYPCGWLMPGGCPGNLEEVFNPLIVAERECGEEVCILDKKRKIAYSLCSSIGEWKKNHQSWLMKKKILTKKVIQLNPERLVSNKGIAHNLIIMKGGIENKTENISVFIDTQTASVSIVLYWRVNIPLKFSELMILDGEDEGKINRPVGLFTEIGIKNDESPELSNIFRSGQRFTKTIDVCDKNIFSIGYCTSEIKEQITVS